MSTAHTTATAELQRLGYTWIEGKHVSGVGWVEGCWQAPPSPKIGHDVLPERLLVMDGRKSPWPRIEEKLRRLLASAWAGANNIDWNRGQILYRGQPEIDFLTAPPDDLQLLMQLNGLAPDAKYAKPAAIHCWSDGMIGFHNMPCPIHQDQHAILNCNTGNFDVSDKARSEGWRLIQLKTKLQRWLFAKFFQE